MSKPSFVHIVVAALFVAAGHPALAVDQTTIDQVVNVAKIGCLLGNQFTFDAKANGDITFAKLDQKRRPDFTRISKRTLGPRGSLTSSSSSSPRSRLEIV